MSALDVGFGNIAALSSFSTAKPRKPTTWTLVCNAFCGGQMLGGLIVCILSNMYLFDVMYWTGILLGALLFCVGAVGLTGSLFAHRDLLNFHIVGAILGIVLSFQFVGQVWREVHVDCALAELYVKSHIMEDISRSFAHESIFDSVYKRMNEMEDMLDVMHYGLGRTVDYLKEKPSETGLDQEKHYLQTKLEVIKYHANKIIQDIIDHPDINNDSVHKWNEQDRTQIESKVKTAEVILHKIQQHEKDDKKNGLRPEEYEEMLSQIYAAVHIPSIPNSQWEHEKESINQLKEDLPYTKGVLSSLRNSMEELDKISQEHSALGEGIHERSDKYRNEFVQLLDHHRQGKEKDHYEEVLQSMPEHCIEESKGVSAMGFIGISVALFQLATIYSTLCISFRLPIKNE